MNHVRAFRWNDIEKHLEAVTAEEYDLRTETAGSKPNTTSEASR